MDYIESLEGKTEAVFLPPLSSDLNLDESAWNQSCYVRISKMLLKNGKPVTNRDTTGLGNIDPKKQRIESFFQQKDVSFAAD